VHRQHADGKQQQRDGYGREEGHHHRVVELADDRRAVAGELGGVYHRQHQEQAERDGRQRVGHGEGETEHVLALVPGQGKAREPHYHGEEGNGEELQPRGPLTTIASAHHHTSGFLY